MSTSVFFDEFDPILSTLVFIRAACSSWCDFESQTWVINICRVFFFYARFYDSDSFEGTNGTFTAHLKRGKWWERHFLRTSSMYRKMGSRMILTDDIDTGTGRRSLLFPPCLRLFIVCVRVCRHSILAVCAAAGNGITCLNGSLSAFITSHWATPAESDLIKPTVARVITH